MGGASVLIVEDDWLVAETVAAHVDALGCSVLGPAASVAEVLMAMTCARPDLVAVLDVNLGRETSFLIADALAAQGTPCVVLTGYERALVPERHASRPLLRKPVALAELREQVVQCSKGSTPRFSIRISGRRRRLKVSARIRCWQERCRADVAREPHFETVAHIELRGFPPNSKEFQCGGPASIVRRPRDDHVPWIRDRLGHRSRPHKARNRRSYSGMHRGCGGPTAAGAMTSFADRVVSAWCGTQIPAGPAGSPP